MAKNTGFSYAVSGGNNGAGFAVVTDRFVCLLGEGSTTEIAGEIYDLLDADATHLDDVFDVLVTRHGLERFGLVEVIEPSTRTFHLAVRGDVSLDLKGTTATRLTGASHAAWLSSEARGVTDMRLALGSDPGMPNGSLPIRRGVVATSLIGLETRTGSAAATPQPVEIVRTQPIDLPTLTKSDGAASTPAGRADLVPRKLETELVPWLLVLPDGSEVDPKVPVVIGRRPWHGSSDERSVVHVVAPSPKREISGVHLELAVVDGTLRGRDLDSTNGTLVYSSTRPTRLLHEGRTTILQLGDILDVGDAFSITVKTRN